MARQLGRISGPLLQENLLRNGVNLSFSNDRTDPNSILLHLDVNNNRIGINTPAPTRDLLVDGTFASTNIIAETGSISNLDFSQGRIENLLDDIEISSSDTILVPTLQTESIEINDNNISTILSNSDLTLTADHSQNIVFDYNTVFEQDLSVLGTAFTDNLLVDNITAQNLSIQKDLTVDRSFRSENIAVEQNVIFTQTSNSNIDLASAGSGSIEIFSNTNVTGNLHATGNINIEGNITLGDQEQDTVTFNSDVNSDIVPASDITYSIGSPTQQWIEIKSALLNGLDIETAVLTVGAVDIGEPQGNTFYVAVNGDNSNRGDHQQGPWASLRYALEQADASTGGPVTIFVYPGEYEEQLPLYVPPNVTVRGADLRNTIIKPDSSSQSEDVFLLDGETTVEDITIRDFYYDSVNDKGYAFRFAEVSSTKTVIASRSPYVRNVSVITRGSVTSPSDPRGFDAGDAGRGALIDGQYVDSSSIDASMLFHSCTFITPNAVAITMRNGVRVEWLNCFTYFADIGLYAVNGALGRLTNDGSTIRRGAEIRSIGSACVYGNRGAVADGDETLMYLIGHNFAYIGTGKDSSNDSTLVIEANQTQELNSGEIYYTSTDARGNFSVGDSFRVDFDTGTTTIAGEGASVTGISSLTIRNGANETFIDAERIETGNIRISGNTARSLTGPVELESASGAINLLADVNVSSNLTTTGDFSVGGTLFTIGNQITDTVEFQADVTSNVLPNSAGIYDLGNASKRWNVLFSSSTEVDDVEINENYITTTASNRDLELLASGTGRIIIDADSLSVTEDFDVSGTTNVADLTIGSLSLTGNRVLNGNTVQQGSLEIAGNFDTDRAAIIEDIQISGNTISTVSSNSDLELSAAGTGSVVINQNNVLIDNNLSVSGTTYLADVNSNTVGAEEFTTGDVSILDNRITTSQSNSHLELGAAGTGNILILADTFEILNDFTVKGITTLSDAVIDQTVMQLGDRQQTGTSSIIGNLNINGNFSAVASDLEEISIRGNVISTVQSNADLELRASGTSNIVFENNAVLSKDMTVLGSFSAGNLNINSSLDLNVLTVLNNIKIDDNYITTTVSNSNLELRANASGRVAFRNILAKQNSIITDSGNIELSPSSENTLVNSSDAIALPTGTTAQSTASDGDLRYNTSISRFQARAGGANAVFNGVYSNDFQSRVFVNDTDNILRFWTNGVERGTITDGLRFSQLQVDDIRIDSSTISTTVSNSDLEFRANGTGRLEIDTISLKSNTLTNDAAGGLLLASTGEGYWKADTSNGLVINSGDSASRRSNPETGETRWNTQEEYMEVYDGVNWSIVTGVGTTISQQEYDDLLLELTLIFG